MQTYAPQEPRSLLGAAAVALTVLTIAALVVGPAQLAQRHAPSALPEVARHAPATDDAATTRARMDVVVDRAAYIEVAGSSGVAQRRGHRG